LTVATTSYGPGDVYSAEGWEEVLLPEIERQEDTRTAADNTNTAAALNGQNEPYCHGKRASGDLRLTRWGRRARLSGQGEAQNGNSSLKGR